MLYITNEYNIYMKYMWVAGLTVSKMLVVNLCLLCKIFCNIHDKRKVCWCFDNEETDSGEDEDAITEILKKEHDALGSLRLH